MRKPLQYYTLFLCVLIGVNSCTLSTHEQSYNNLNVEHQLYSNEYAYSYEENLINSNHSCSIDFMASGQAYTNMANRCKLEGDTTLAYLLYRKSADLFLLSNDSLLYFNALNNTASTLASMSLFEQSTNILDSIEQICHENRILMKTWETRAIVCLRRKQYISAINWVNHLQSHGYNEPLGYMIKAQSFSLIEEKDSAMFYAYKVLSLNCNWSYIKEAFDILLYNENNNHQKFIHQVTTNRTYIKNKMEQRQVILLQAGLFLKQKLIYSYSRWLYMVIVILSIAFCALNIRLLFQRRLQLQNDIQLHKKQRLESFERHCNTLRDLSNDQLIQELHWTDFSQMSKIVNARMMNIVDILTQNTPMLSEKEIRLCILVLLNLSRKRESELLMYAESGIGKLKHTTAHKMGTTGKKMRDFLLNKLD